MPTLQCTPSKYSYVMYHKLKTSEQSQAALAALAPETDALRQRIAAAEAAAADQRRRADAAEATAAAAASDAGAGAAQLKDLRVRVPFTCYSFHFGDQRVRPLY